MDPVGGDLAVLRVSPALGSRLRGGVMEATRPLRSGDPSPDDQRLLVIRFTEGGTEVRVVLVQNFFEELRQVVPDP